MFHYKHPESPTANMFKAAMKPPRRLAMPDRGALFADFKIDSLAIQVEHCSAKFVIIVFGELLDSAKWLPVILKLSNSMSITHLVFLTEEDILENILRNGSSIRNFRLDLLGEHTTKFIVNLVYGIVRPFFPFKLIYDLKNLDCHLSFYQTSVQTL